MILMGRGSRPRQIVSPGQRFGRWVAVDGEAVYPRKEKRRYTLVKCECGNQSHVAISSLYNGQSKQCTSCVAKDKGAKRSDNYSPEWQARQVAYGYRKNASSRNLTWELTDSRMSEIIFKDCVYCLSPPSNQLRKYGNRNIVYNGIDRIDSSTGYVDGNVAPCCFKCNYAKNNMSTDEFLHWLGLFGANVDEILNRLDEWRNNGTTKTISVKEMARDSAL